MIRKSYAQSRHGQIHLRVREAQAGLARRNLVLLHPMPYSGLYFTTFMNLFDGERTTIAPDYPGFGQSSFTGSAVSIQSFANAVIDALEDLGIDGECDFLGFHTGCLVAAEIAIAKPSLVSSIILVDIPFFEETRRQELLASLSSHKSYSEDLACLQSHWNSDVTSRVGRVPLRRAVDLFADHIAAQGDGADGFRAAFNYPVSEQFKQVAVPACVIATTSGLYEGSLSAAKLIHGVTLVKLPQVTTTVFELGAEDIAKATKKWLSRIK